MKEGDDKDMMRTLNEKIRNTKGFMSLEAIGAMTVVLMVIILGIGFFTYMMPKQQIEQEVNLLGRMAKMNGGLTAKDVTDFKNKMLTDRGYPLDKVKVTMVLKDSAGTVRTYVNNGVSVNPLNITCKYNPNNTPRTTSNQFCDSNLHPKPLYVNRTAQLIMEIRVETPANKKGLLGALGFLSADKNGVSDVYVFKERVMSERH